MNKLIKILMVIVIIGSILVLISCQNIIKKDASAVTQKITQESATTTTQKITQEDVDRELSRWWVIYYKMWEDESLFGQIDINKLVARPDGVDGILENEFGEDYIYRWDKLSWEDKYRYVLRRNELMEEALVKLRGTVALKEIDNIWSLDEAPELWEKVNKQGGDNMEEQKDKQEEKVEVEEKETYLEPEVMEVSEK